MSEDYWDEQVAANYDLSSAAMFDPRAVDPVVDFLVDLAGDGRALEFAIGTGRIALPLSRRGVEVHGIDLSPFMVERLEAKEGSAAIESTVGDMTATRVGDGFRVVYLVFNSIGNLMSQDAQVDCFRNAATHLAPGGYFVVENMVPALQGLPLGETVRAFDLSPTHLGFDEYDVVTQAGVSHHYWAVDGTYTRWSMPWRYAWPAELDLMARLAGMRLSERWGGWRKEPFTSTSPLHVSVWQKGPE